VISFDLKCTHAHVFEVWFRNSGAYEEQRVGGLIACPICGDTNIEKAVMAPAVAAKGNRRQEITTRPEAMIEAGSEQRTELAQTPVTMAADAKSEVQMKALLGALAQAQAKALEKSQWVGNKFGDMVRAMHYGEADHAAIHGTAEPAEARAMIEEGLPVAPLIVPVAPTDQTH
jgi:hypothetical protein